MSDRHREPTHGADLQAEPEFDRDVEVRRVVGTGVWLAAVIAVSMILMWWLVVSLRSAEQAADPPRSPLPEVSEPGRPPAPWLQPVRWQDLSPERELAAMRAEEQRVLGSYGWVNEAGGIARIPVERAIELAAERGLPRMPPEGASPAAQLPAAESGTGPGGSEQGGRDVP
jgi:hypothetical protein